MTPASSNYLDATDWGSDVDTPLSPISLDDVLRANETIKQWLTPTPLLENPLLSARVGTETHVKLENMQDIGVFKIRGALNLLASMSREERAMGIVTATRGNYGAAFARACALHGVQCTVFVPTGNNPDKNASIKSQGAELIVQGHDFDAAWDASVRYARKKGALSIHPAKRPELVAGQGTVALEMLDQVDGKFDVIFVPVGGGSLAAGTTTVVKARSPETKIIAVQAENAPAFHNAWHTHRYAPMAASKTIADGLAVRIPVRYTLSMMQNIDDFVLVSEEEICTAIRCYAETIHHLAEGGGAAPLAAALGMRDQLKGKRVGLILTGSNIDSVTLLKAMQPDSALHAPLAVPDFPLASIDYGDR